MSDQSKDNSPSPSETSAPEPKVSLRDTIENAYDDVLDQSEAPEDAGQSDRTRDSLGRFAAKDRVEPGEQSEDPAPKPITEAQFQREPARESGSTQTPQHWSAEFKADFEKLPPEGRAILLKRHTEMEADYTRKSQASAGAVQFASALEPVFSDPVITQSMQQAGMNAIQAIHEWGGFHKRALSPDVRERVSLLVDLSQRMGLDPARLFAGTSNQQVPELSPEDMNDPAIRYFADRLGSTTNDLQAVKAQLQHMLQSEAQQREQETVGRYRAGIDQFADEKDSQGNPAHPHFAKVADKLIEMYTVDPTRNLAQAYDEAVWANPETRALMLEAEQHRLFGSNSAQRARAAVRGNIRGLTSPVAKPNASTANGSLRSTLEASADEVGF
jgi:hypothetical protein